MKHKLYESWILDNPDLDPDQRKDLAAHLAVCLQCRKLQANWQASQKSIQKATQHEPKPGFTQRWSKMAGARIASEKSRQVRRTLMILAIVTVFASIFYAIQNNVFIAWLVTALSVLSSFIISITKSLASIEEIFTRQPEVVMTMGFILIGGFTAFLAVFFFTIWHTRKESMVYEK